ncbi:hypothetical protein NIES3974_36250 [Calothrix sp. NIES-3974]|nr:hypothetical protein NIES3974_36250 [Calothrix sp. NIES-3974]
MTIKQDFEIATLQEAAARLPDDPAVIRYASTQ